MLIPLLIYWVITKIMPVVDSTPLKNGVFDHLVSNVENESSDGYLSNDMAVSILRQANSPEQSINTEKYEGYTFDHTRCIQFNNRILCGYEKNKGTLLDDYTMFDIGNGCRTRGDRIECGYDNPHFNTNLRNPAVDHRDHGENDKDSERNQQHHHHRAHHHRLEKYHDTLPRLAPTRTAAITDPTTPSIIMNRMKSDYLENKLLKSALSKLVMKAEEIHKDREKTTINLIELITSSTDTVKPLSTTTTIPITRKSTLTPGSIRKSPTSKTGKAETLTSTTIITTSLPATTSLPTSSESNDISDGKPAPKIVRLKPVIKQKRRLLTELLSRFPKFISKPKLDGTIVRPIENSRKTKINDAVLRMKTDRAEKNIEKQKKQQSTELLSPIPKLVRISDSTIIPPIANNCDTTINDTVLRMETSSAEKQVKTACVEQEDRVVCYDFKT